MTFTHVQTSKLVSTEVKNSNLGDGDIEIFSALFISIHQTLFLFNVYNISWMIFTAFKGYGYDHTPVRNHLVMNLLSTY